MNPYVIIGLIVAWLVSLAVVGSWQHADGVDDERLVWKVKENKELADANQKILDLTAAARAQEAAHATELQKISADYEGELSNARSETKRLNGLVRAGTLRLRDPAGTSTCGSPSGPIATGSGQRDGATGSELSTEASQFLLELTGEADEVTRQLQACQAVVSSDRKKLPTPNQ